MIGLIQYFPSVAGILLLRFYEAKFITKLYEEKKINIQAKYCQVYE
jgi:hypothetical protein